MPYLAKKTELGKLELRDVYVFYDFPRLFSCINNYGQEYLALSIGESDKEYSWVYVAVSSKRLANVISGKVDLRDAFKKPEDGGVLLVSISAECDRVVPILPSEVADVVLPKPGHKLHLSKSRPVVSALIAESSSSTVGITDIVRQAFLDIRGGVSVDKVIADPRLDKTFLKRCQELGLAHPAIVLNRQLMGMRKAGQLSGLNSQKFVMDGNISDKVDYASELAWRYLTLTKGVSLDDILCAPELAKEFDDLARSMSPDFESFYYRWAALQVRKSGRHAKEGLELRGTFDFGGPMKITSLRKKDIPVTCGLYLFSYDNKPLFVSQADSIRQRLEMHLEYTLSRGLPEWIWPWKRKIIEVAFASAPNIPKTKRQGMEVDQVLLKKPLFNVQRCHAA